MIFKMINSLRWFPNEWDCPIEMLMLGANWYWLKLIDGVWFWSMLTDADADAIASALNADPAE